MVSGVPVGKITWTMVAVIALFVLAGVAFAATGNSDLAHGALGTATGIAIGSGGSVALTINANRGGDNEKTDSAGKAA